MSETKKTTNTDIFVAIGILETKLDNLTKAVEDIKDGVKVDIESLKNNKVDKDEINRVLIEQNKVNLDVETRMRFLERYVWSAVATISLLMFALNYFHPFAK